MTLDHIEQSSHLPPHLRIGWANTKGYVSYPGGGEKWGGNGVGDDLYSYGFDGSFLWTGGRYTLVNPLVSKEGKEKGVDGGEGVDDRGGDRRIGKTTAGNASNRKGKKIVI